MRTEMRKTFLVLIYTTFLAFCSGIQSEELQSRSRHKRQTVCADKDRRCSSFKNSGYCTNSRYQTWMRGNCARSCGTCVVVNSGGSCQDLNRYCRDWASKGECQKNPAYMLVNCKRSCGKCSSSTCVDKQSWSYCQTNRRWGYCTRGSYVFWMKQNCARTCGFCKVPIHGKWSSWTPYQSCSVTCGTGVQKRTRRCNNPSPKNGGKTCPGSSSQTVTCKKKACAVDGKWSSWGLWYSCSKTCGVGTKRRHRACNKPSPQNGGKNCNGNNVQFEPCKLKECPRDGGWSPWGSWFECSKSCGEDGIQIRIRNCDNPRPDVGGKNCAGKRTEKRSCNIKPCPSKPINGNWSLWSVWSFCSPECLRSRTRLCDNPQPQNGGRLCQGDSLEMMECTGGSCKGPDVKKCGTRIQRGRIVGGVKVYPGEFPWQAGIKRIFQSKVFCGGSLIDDEWIVTASHCVDGEDAEILEVLLGDVDQSTQDGQEITVEVKRYFKHPNYNSNNFDNDIALIQLKERVTFSKYIKPVCLPNKTTAEAPNVGTKCFVTGFGRVQEGGSLSPSLRQAELPVVNRTVCAKAYEDYQDLTENMFCVGREEGGVDSCQGDSGGPLVCEVEEERFYLAGVVSWGVGCARKKRYGVYADVAILKSWVNEKRNQIRQEP